MIQTYNNLITQDIESRVREIGFPLEQFKIEASFALQIWNNPKNSYLRKANTATLLNSLLNVAQIGLTLNPASKEAYLIPRKNGNVIECHLEPSYIGLCKLITNTGSVVNIQTNLRYQNDVFTVDLAKGEYSHIPSYLENKEPGSIVGVYSIAFLPNGNKQFEYIPIDEVYKIRDTSESYKSYKKNNLRSCIWIDYKGEMIRKTCLKRLTKYLPRGSDFNKFEKAVTLTNRDFEIKEYQIDQIENLLRTCSLSQFNKDNLERDLPSLNFNSASQMIEYLKNNQIDPISSGENYTQTDINQKLDNIMQDNKK